MREFLRHVSPLRAARDLWQVLGAPSEYRVRSLLMAMTITGGLVWVILQQGGRGPPLLPEVIYFDSWPADRSDAEIIAGNIEATKRAKAEAAADEARAERMRQMYKAVGAASGLDAQTMYDKGKAEREAAARATEARRKAVLDKLSVPRDGKRTDQPEAR